MGNEIALRPSYWASVSGGKDSLFMLKLILHNLDKYPLDGVIHFELDIDYPFIKNVIDYMQKECERHGIRFVRIKPRKSWMELYSTPYEKTGNIRGFPTRKARWCNSEYKLDARRQLNEFMAKQGFYVVYYIGYCADEETRFAKRVDLQKVERYPLVEENIFEDIIWEWAKNQPIFNHYYETSKPCFYYHEKYQIAEKVQKWERTVLTEEQLEEYFGLKIIRFEFSEPIQNEFKYD